MSYYNKTNISTYEIESTIDILLLIICIVFIILLYLCSYFKTTIINRNQHNNIIVNLDNGNLDNGNGNNRPYSIHDTNHVIIESTTQNEILLTSNINPPETEQLKGECHICIEDFKENDELYKLKCGHIFHTKCITEWINIESICPTCRSTSII